MSLQRSNIKLNETTSAICRRHPSTFPLFFFEQALNFISIHEKKKTFSLSLHEQILINNPEKLLKNEAPWGARERERK